MLPLPSKIVSGGQTGVDRAALDVAILLGLEHGGWCPLGRRAEDGVIPRKYQLQELQTPMYHVRTEQNVVDSDGTLILFFETCSGGTALTERLAKKHGKPVHLVDLNELLNTTEIQSWIQQNAIQVLNVAGPRASSSEGVQDLAQEALMRILDAC